MADGIRGRRASGDQFRQVRDQVIAAAFQEFGGKVRGPVGAVSFKRVGEDGVRGRISEGLHQRLADLLQVLGDGVARERIEHPTIGVDRGALDLLTGVASYEKDGNAGLVGRGEGGGSSGDGDGLGGGGVEGRRTRTAASSTAAGSGCGGSCRRWIGDDGGDSRSHLRSRRGPWDSPRVEPPAISAVVASAGTGTTKVCSAVTASASVICGPP